MATTVKQVFEQACAHLQFDAAMAKRIINFEQRFAHKNADHIAFFGGNLTGVHRVRFLPMDQMRWFEEVLEADDVALEAQLHALPGINPDWEVSSNVMNLSCVWVLHELHTSTLPEKLKKDAMMSTILVLEYKYLTSRLYRHFTHTAVESVAKATYMAMSNKFLLKQCGTWGAYLRYIGDGNLDHKAIVRMERDRDVVEFLNATQGQIREMLKNIYNLHLIVDKQGQRVDSTSMTVELDGVSMLKDGSRSLFTYTRYLHSIVADPASFVRPELVQIIASMLKTMSPAYLTETLRWISMNYHQRSGSDISEALDEILIHSFAYLGANRSLLKDTGGLANLLQRFRGIYTSSRSTDPTLLALRKRVEKLVGQATGSKHLPTLAAVRTGVMLYCILRTYSMRHYTNLTVTE